MLWALTVYDYDRGRSLEGDEGTGKTRGVYADPDLVFCWLRFSRSLTNTCSGWQRRTEGVNRRA